MAKKYTMIIKSKRENLYSKVQNRGQESAPKTNVKTQVDIVVGMAKGKKEKGVLLWEWPSLPVFIFYPP